ncbi:MAG: LuxR C-terminal-related transcriptional regulator, partial [Bacteroidota bacterium]
FNNYGGMTYSLGNLSNVYAAIGDYKKADSIVQLSLYYAGIIENKRTRIEVLLNAYQVYEKFGQYRKALVHYQAYNKLQDSVFNVDKAKIIADMEAKYQTEKKEVALKQQEVEIAVLDKERTVANTRSLVLGTLAVSLGVIGLLVYHQQKIKRSLAISELDLTREREEKLKVEMEYKDKELINFALQISEKDAFIEELGDHLKSLGKEATTDLTPLMQAIRSNQFLSKDRESFDQHVQDVCEGFFARLNSRFPDITAGEMKLAALIRMGLSSKEISSVVNISAKSVDMRRYRLRKKMELHNDSNLMEALLSI